MKCVKNENLFKLNKNKVTGEGGAITSTSAQSADNDDTVLWAAWPLNKRSILVCLSFHKNYLLKCEKSYKLSFCKYRVYRKQRKFNFKVASHTIIGVLDYVHLDFWRPVAMSSNEGAYCFFRFIDVRLSSKFCWNLIPFRLRNLVIYVL